jgi:hypothetical protein
VGLKCISWIELGPILQEQMEINEGKVFAVLHCFFLKLLEIRFIQFEKECSYQLHRIV